MKKGQTNKLTTHFHIYNISRETNSWGLFRLFDSLVSESQTYYTHYETGPKTHYTFNLTIYLCAKISRRSVAKQTNTLSQILLSISICIVILLSQAPRYIFYEKCLSQVPVERR